MHFNKIVPTLSLAALCVGNPIEISERESCRVTSGDDTNLVGDGNPHQNWIYKQVSETTDCTGNPSSSTSITDTQTVDYSLSANVAIGWFTGGFAVSESFSTGSTNSFGCATEDGGSQDGSLCVFERIQTTAYTAQTRSCSNSTCSGNDCTDWSEPVIITAPNDLQAGCFYDNFQLTDVGISCQYKGYQLTIADGPAGGPPDTPFAC